MKQAEVPRQRRSSSTIAIMSKTDDRNYSLKSAGITSSTSGHSSLTSANDKIEEQDRHVARVVRRLKLAILTFFTLTAAGVIIAFSVYRNSNKKAQHEAFKNKFHQDAKNMLASLGTSIDSTLAATDSFAISMLSEARLTNQTWPFVTISDYAVKASKLMKNTRAKFITNYMFIQEEQRAEWEAYAAANADSWIQDAIKVQANDRGYNGPNITAEYVEENYIGHYDKIHGYDEAVFGWGGESTSGVSHPGPYLPLWQQSPVIPIYPLYNWYVLVDLSSFR